MHYHTTVQVRTNSLVIYNEPTESRKFSRTLNPFKNIPKAYSGTVTAGAKKRITKAVTLLIQSTTEKVIFNPVSQKNHPFKLSFITLTVSSSTRMLTAKEAHKTMLEPFLLYLRRRHGMRSYIWKAELQKRGQIHYHLTSDVFIKHSTLRDKWNELQHKNGLLDDYFKLKGHRNANSTDVHSVYRVKNIEAYLIKYLAKPGSEKEATTGKIWDCSQNLKQAGYFTTTSTYDLEAELHKREQAKNITVYRAERFTIVSVSGVPAHHLLPPQAQQSFNLHIKSIRNYTRAPVSKSADPSKPEMPGLLYPLKLPEYIQGRIIFSKKV